MALHRLPCPQETPCRGARRLQDGLLCFCKLQHNRSGMHACGRASSTECRRRQEWLRLILKKELKQYHSLIPPLPLGNVSHTLADISRYFCKNKTPFLHEPNWLNALPRRAEGLQAHSLAASRMAGTVCGARGSSRGHATSAPTVLMQPPWRPIASPTRRRIRIRAEPVGKHRPGPFASKTCHPRAQRAPAVPATRRLPKWRKAAFASGGPLLPIRRPSAMKAACLFSPINGSAPPRVITR